MGVYAGPDIREDGLVLALDAADPNNYNLTAVEVLVVAGGGGGGSHHGGGGGAGGLIYNSNFAVTPGSALTVTVGNGGAGGGNNAAGTSPVGGVNGENSVFGSLTAIGGGGGASYGYNGNNGGSGGGSNNWVVASGGSATSGQGFSGGSNGGEFNTGGGGGGAGGTAKGLSNNSGGDGLQFPQFASVGGSPAGWFAGGGAAGVYPGYTNDTSYGTGGLGGGGNGGNGPHESGSGKTSGVDNTGGGGGSSADLYQNGAAGGSGIVIVRYPGPQRAIGGTVTSVGGYMIHTFTTVETTSFTPLAATNDSAILGLADFSGNNNFGTTVNSPTYSSANGGSVSFDGTNEYINCGSAGSLSLGAFTLSAWVKVSTNVSDYRAIIVDESPGGSPWNYRLYVNRDNGILVCDINGGGYGSVTSTFAINNNTWYHVCATRSSVGGALSMYINGVLSNTSTDGSSRSTLANQVWIGQSPYSGGAYPMNGNIAQVQIYNKALTASEIQQNFNASRGRFGI
jgi:hypothetical protein